MANNTAKSVTLTDKNTGEYLYPYTSDSLVKRTNSTYETVKDALDALEAGSTSREGYVVAKTASDFKDENTIYEIRDEINLGGNTLNIPANSVLKFEGGEIKNGLLNLNGCELQGNVNITAEPNWNELNEFEEGYKPSNKVLYVSWFGATGDGETDDAPALKRCIKWLHKNGATMVFDKSGTYILGDGIQDPINDPNKTLHTGYSYEADHALNGTKWPTSLNTNAKRKAYIEAHPVNIGRDIVLRFFRFTNLKVEGNGSIVRSHEGNGYCKHNEVLRIAGCYYCTFENLEVDGNVEARLDSGHIPTALMQDGNFIPSEFGSPYDIYIAPDNEEGNKSPSYRKRMNGQHSSDIPVTRDQIRGFRQLHNIAVAGGEFITFRNIISRNSLSNGLTITGTQSSSSGMVIPAKNFIIENCIATNAVRICFSIANISNVSVSNSTFQYSGYGVDGVRQIWPEGQGACAPVDLEDDALLGINNVVFNRCVVRYNVKNDNGIILNKGAQNCKVLNCYFERVGVNPIRAVGALNNEVAYCTFERGMCGCNQEGINVHHNTMHVFVGNGSFWGGDAKNKYIKGRITGTEKLLDPDDPNKGSDKASEATSRFCDNVITLDYYARTVPQTDKNGVVVDTGSYVEDGVTYYYALPTRTSKAIYDNLIMDRNVFQNVYGNNFQPIFNLRIVSFRSNKFQFDTTKYPVLNEDVFVKVLPFNGFNYDTGRETTQGCEVHIDSSSDDSEDSGEITTIKNYGTTAERPVLDPILQNNFQYYDTTVKQPIYYINDTFPPFRVFQVRHAKGETAHSKNILEKGKCYAVVKNNSSNYNFVFAFRKEIDSETDQIIVHDHSTQGITTVIIKAPDPTEYPYIYTSNPNGSNAPNFKFTVYSVGRWVDGTGFTPNLHKGPTSSIPTSINNGGNLIPSLDRGFSYYDTTLNKNIVTKLQQTRVNQISFNSTAGTYKYVSNPFEEGKQYYLSGTGGYYYLYFATGNDSSASDYEEFCILGYTDASTNTSIVAPDPSVYPYIKITNSANGQKLYYDIVDLIWVEEDGATAGVARSGDTRPDGSDIYVGFEFFDTTLSKPIYARAISGDTVTWVDEDGFTPAIKRGTTSNRPTLTSGDSGFQYYDTTLNKYICWNGSTWVNLDGTALT